MTCSLVVDHPHVLGRIVRAHLDRVRSASTRLLREQLVVLRPLFNKLAVAIDDEEDVLEPAFPSALRGRLAGGAQPVGVGLRVAARGVERRVRRPGFRSRRERQFAAHGDPDAIRRLGVNAAQRTPRPAVMRMTGVRKRLGPVRHHLVRAGRPILMALPGFRLCGKLRCRLGQPAERACQR